MVKSISELNSQNSAALDKLLNEINLKPGTDQKQQVNNENVENNRKEIDKLKNNQKNLTEKMIKIYENQSKLAKTEVDLYNNQNDLTKIIQDIVRSLKNYQLKGESKKEILDVLEPSVRYSSIAFLYEPDWAEIEALIGDKEWQKAETDKMKQGANFTGTLSLPGYSLDADACRILAPALAETKGLEQLMLSMNNIRDEGCRHLAPALAKMEGLERLWLQNNKIGEEGCRHLAPALAKMEELKELHLDINTIGNEGCRILAPALAKMKGLEELSLQNNNMSGEGKAVIREAWNKAGKDIDGFKF